MILLKATLIVGILSITTMVLLGLTKNQVFAQFPMLPPNINNDNNNGGSTVTAPDSQLSSKPAVTPPPSRHSNSSSLLSNLPKLYKPKSDAPAAEEGFLVHNETLFRISYPSNWTKQSVLLGRFTVVKSTPFVGFLAPSSQKASIVISMNVIGNRLLSDYAGEEIDTLKYIPGFKLDQSSSSTVGNNTAQKIVYTTSEVKNGVISGTLKTMEIVTIKDGAAYHLVYSAKENDFPTLLPIVNKMINSFEFNPNPYAV